MAQTLPCMAGQFNFDGTPLSPSTLERLTLPGTAPGAAQQVGYLESGCAAVFTPNSFGPIASLDGTVWVLCDGRIDNREELASLLRDRGQDPYSASDADYVRVAYHRWGTDCPRHLLGDFAIVIFDAAQRTIFLARDPAQFFPLYYRLEKDRLVWATHPRLLLAAPAVSRQYDNVYLTTFLVLGNLNWERTPWDAIKQVKGGWSLTIDRDGKTRHDNWWQLGEPETLKYKRIEDYAHHLRHLTREAVKCRLRTPNNGPVSIALSRGIDSACVAVEALQLIRDGEASCSGVQGISFSTMDTHPEADESTDAARIARHIGLTHHIVASPGFVADLRAYMAQYREPNFMVGMRDFWLPIARRMQETDSHVLLTGGGGGELFEYMPATLGVLAIEQQWLSLIREIWRCKRAGHPIYKAVRRIAQCYSQREQCGQPDYLVSQRPWIKHPELLNFDTPGFTLPDPTQRGAYQTFVEHGSGEPGLDDLFSPLGIAVCRPLWDRRLVEFSWSLPVLMKIPRERNKPVQRLAFASELPGRLTRRNPSYDNLFGEGISQTYEVLREILMDPPLGMTAAMHLEVLEGQLNAFRSGTGEVHLLSVHSLACWLEANQRVK